MVPYYLYALCDVVELWLLDTCSTCETDKPSTGTRHAANSDLLTHAGKVGVMH